MQANTMTAKDCHRTTALVVLVKYHDYPPVQLGNLQRGKRFRGVLEQRLKKSPRDFLVFRSIK